jgi:DNA polymerase I
VKAQESPIVRDLIVYRRIRAEVIDLEKLLRALHPDNRIHARYNPAGAGTGRMSSKSPNLQNIRRPPTKADQALGYINFRKFFIAPPGWQTIKADYNQAELRGAAVIANEPNMLEAYRNREDLHWKTAAGITPGFSEMTPEEQGEARFKAKAPNFGLIYGMSAPGFRRYAAQNYDLQLSFAMKRSTLERLGSRYIQN